MAAVANLSLYAVVFLSPSSLLRNMTLNEVITASFHIPFSSLFNHYSTTDCYSLLVQSELLRQHVIYIYIYIYSIDTPVLPRRYCPQLLTPLSHQDATVSDMFIHSSSQFNYCVTLIRPNSGLLMGPAKHDTKPLLSTRTYGVLCRIMSSNWYKSSPRPNVISIPRN